MTTMVFDTTQELLFNFLSLIGRNNWLLFLNILLGILFVLSLPQISTGKKYLTSLYFLIVFITMFYSKLPIFIMGELDFDESLNISIANTLYYSFKPWVSADTTTYGPIMVIPQLFVKLFGPLTYSHVRILSMVIWFFTFVFLYNIVNILINNKYTKLYLYPFVIFFCFLFDKQIFAIYQTEVFPILLLTIAIYLYLLIFYAKSQKFFIGKLFLLGFIIGSIPLSKIQASPIAFVIGLFTVLQLFKDKKKLIAFILACLLPLITLLLYLHFINGINDFFQSYISSNFQYAAHGVSDTRRISFLQRIVTLPDYFYSNVDFGFSLTLLILGIILIILFLSYKSMFTKLIRENVFLLCVFLLISSIYSIIQPGTNYKHYLMFSVVPLFVTFYYLIAFVIKAIIINSRDQRFILVGIFVLIALPMQMKMLNATYKQFDISKKNFLLSPVSQEIIKLNQKKESIAIWGWYTSIYVETQMVQGTRDGHTYHQANSYSPLHKYYIDRYIYDLERNKPRIFIDASGLGNFKREMFFLNNFSEINSYIQSHYNYYKSVNDLKIYILK